MTNSDPTPITIPENLDDCQALIEQLVCQLEELSQKKQELEMAVEKLEVTVEELTRRLAGNRSERYIDDPNQLKFDLGDSEEAADAAEGLADAAYESEQIVQSHTRRKRKPRTENLPDHLERYEVVKDAPDEIKNCPEHGPRKEIGYDCVETLDFVPPKLRVRVTKYPKFVCEGHPDCGVGSPERPAGLVEGDRYDTSVAAEIITAKYSYHLPLYRQQDLFAGSGWTPSRSTLLNILMAAAFAIRPLVEHFKQVVLADDILGTDETRVTLLLPETIPEVDPADPKSVRIHEVFAEAVEKKKRSIGARMWAYRSVITPLNVFDFTVSRHRDGPDLMLSDYSGILMADCYSGFEGIALASDGRIQRAACVAHARRKVFDARGTYPLEASVVLAKFQQLYDIEDRARVLSLAERAALRQEEAVPIWESLDQWLKSPAATKVLPKSDFGKALNYLRNHWEQLQTYLADPRCPIDNNEVEQLMKQVALGRKNWLFVGSVAAGERAADFLTLVSSAVRNDLDVWAYTKDVLDRLLAGDTDYDSMRPDIWRESHPEFIRAYRVVERRDRADRKQSRRAARRSQQSVSRN